MSTTSTAAVQRSLVTQMDYARAGIITPQMKTVAAAERRDVEYIRERVADGRIAIPANIHHIEAGLKPCGVGEGLSTKVNVNLGISGDKADADEERRKVEVAVTRGADAIMDLSNSGKTRFFRQELVQTCPLMIGTVPMYDANDAVETAEMIELGKLTKRAWDAGVQVMVEGPGHMAIDEIAANVKLQKRLCHNAPYYVLGPLVTDIGVGYDHITAAIGGAISASAGADFLCYVTPAEHLCLPDAHDVLEGLIATKIAAHAADIAKGVPGARDVDNRMGQARRKLDWDQMWGYALDPATARERREASPAATEGTCTMCGKMCAVRTVNKVLEGTTIDLDAS